VENKQKKERGGLGGVEGKRIKSSLYPGNGKETVGIKEKQGQERLSEPGAIDIHQGRGGEKDMNKNYLL